VNEGEILRYMRSRVTEYNDHGALNTTALAGDACAHFGLWVNDTVPAQLFDLADRVERGMQLFVEKRINYEPDGDVLFA